MEAPTEGIPMKCLLNLAAASVACLIVCSSSIVNARSQPDDLIMGFHLEEWTLGSQGEDKTQRVMEFVPPGQKIESWTELLTVQTLKMPRKPPDIDTMAATTFDNLAKRCPGNVTSNVIAREAASPSSGESILFEWSVKDCPPEANQHEVAKIVYGKFSMFRIAFTAKTDSLAPEKREKWIAELTATKIFVH